MKKLFTHENRLIVFNMMNVLQDQGIDCQLRNEFSGGGVGDLAAFEIWPELWVADSDETRAQTVLASLQQESQGQCLCPACGAENEIHFALCWNCSQPLTG